MIRRFAQLAAITGAAVALMTSTAAAAPVAQLTEAEILACHNAEAPTKTPGWVHGKGSGTCGQVVDVFVQRWEGLYWKIRGQAYYTGPGSAVASYNCTGVGHYTYRTLVQWRDGQGPKSSISEERRFEC